MKTNEFVKYVTPKVEVFEVEVEIGYAASDESDGDVSGEGMGGLN